MKRAQILQFPVKDRNGFCECQECREYLDSLEQGSKGARKEYLTLIRALLTGEYR